jgi:hypothetical protein
MKDLADIPVLHELIEALNRRAPQAGSGEAAIARDAASLKSRALARIAELEHDAACVKSDLLPL